MSRGSEEIENLKSRLRVITDSGKHKVIIIGMGNKGSVQEALKYLIEEAHRDSVKIVESAALNFTKLPIPIKRIYTLDIDPTIFIKQNKHPNPNFRQYQNKITKPWKKK